MMNLGRITEQFAESAIAQRAAFDREGNAINATTAFGQAAQPVSETSVAMNTEFNPGTPTVA